MSEISGRPLKDIKIIAMDGKFDQDSSHKALPGMFAIEKPMVRVNNLYSHS